MRVVLLDRFAKERMCRRAVLVNMCKGQVLNFVHKSSGYQRGGGISLHRINYKSEFNGMPKNIFWGEL